MFNTKKINRHKNRIFKRKAKYIGYVAGNTNITKYMLVHFIEYAQPL